MPKMYCPQCGRELDLDSGDVHFCRYCGFALTDTKESLQGYSEQKRVGFSVVTWSYVVLLLVTLLLHGRYISLDTSWSYWLSAILIVASVSLFASASVSALKPSLFAKRKRDGLGELKPHREARGALVSAERITDDLSELTTRERITARVEPPTSVSEGTTRKLNN